MVTYQHHITLSFSDERVLTGIESEPAAPAPILNIQCELEESCALPDGTIQGVCTCVLICNYCAASKISIWRHCV